jgi:thiol-disulfide isomerase/thioredoxin
MTLHLHFQRFYAPWCKTCQKIGRTFDRIAKEYGDVIQDRHKIVGSIRFAQVEYTPRSAPFITKTLQVQGVPTLQLYQGTRKLWEAVGTGGGGTGAKSINGLQLQLDAIKGMAYREREELAITNDDGILQAAMEEAFFQPEFLNEEW